MRYYSIAAEWPRTGRYYVEFEATEEDLQEQARAKRGVEEAGLALELEESIFTEEQMQADPTRADALDRWNRGDQSLRAQTLANHVLIESGPNASSTPGPSVTADEMEVLTANKDLPNVAAALRCLELQAEMFDLSERFGVPYGQRVA